MTRFVLRLTEELLPFAICGFLVGFLYPSIGWVAVLPVIALFPILFIANRVFGPVGYLIQWEERRRHSRNMSAMEQRNSPSHYDAVLEVLEGKRTNAVRDADIKMLFIIFSDPRGADLEISRSGFTARFGWHPSRHRYFLDAAPAVVGAVMAWCGKTSATTPFAARVRRSAMVLRQQPTAHLADTDRDVWLFPGSPLRIQVRESGPASPSSDSPPPVIRYQRSDVRLREPYPCPACGVFRNQFRVLRDAWVCGDCGRSFEPPEGPLAIEEQSPV